MRAVARPPVRPIVPIRLLVASAVVAALAVLTGLAVLPGGPSGHPAAPADRSQAPAAASGWAIHRSGPAPASGRGPAAGLRIAASGGTTYTVCNSNYNLSPPSCYNFTLANSSCASVPGNVTLAPLGLGLIVASTPASGVGPAPLNFSWNITVGGGGLPPYQVAVLVYDSFTMINATNLTGTIPLTTPGLYTVDVLAMDSTCTQSALVSFPLEVYGSLGPNPVRIHTSVSYARTVGEVPATVTYAVNTSGYAANDTVLWISPETFGQSGPAGIANLSYYVPGTYSAEACVAAPANGTGNVTSNDSPPEVVLACNASAPVTLGGLSPIVTSVAVGSGAFPVNVTYAVNWTWTPGSAGWNLNTTLPTSADLYVIAYAADGVGTWNESLNGSGVNVTIPVGCGPGFTSYVPPSGNCTYAANWSIIDPSLAEDAGYLGGGTFFANLTANGTPSLWDPAVAWSSGPLNGSLPFNLSVNLSVTGGKAPYQYDYAVFGRSNGSANATVYPTEAGIATGWNGSAVTVLVALNRTGVYYASFFVSDANDNWAGFDLPLVVLGNVSPLRPLHVTTTVGPGAGGNPLPAGNSTWFVAEPVGGVGPYAIQWNFGDGSYGTSVPGASVAHRYAAPGNYTVTVTVVDATGGSVSTTLPTIVVVAGPSSGPGGHETVGPGPATPGSGNGPAEAAAFGLGAAAIVGLGVLLIRRELRRQGEQLAESLGAGGDDASAGSDSRP